LKTNNTRQNGTQETSEPFNPGYLSARSIRQLPSVSLHSGWSLRQLQIILAIAELGSLSKASERLHIAQPALSRHLRLLEKGLGVTVFERKPYGMELTPAGELLVCRSASILRQLDDLRSELISMSGDIIGRHVFAMPPILADEFGARLVGAFKQTFPKVSLRLVTGFSGHVAEWLERGEVDMAVIYDGPKTVSLDSKSLVSERLFLVGPKSARLSMRRHCVFKSLVDKPLILSGLQHTPRAIIEDIASKTGIALRVVLEVDSTRVTKAMVVEGHGYTIMPMSSVYAEVKNNALTIAPIVNPIPACKMILASAPGRPASAIVNYLSELIHDEIKSLLAKGFWVGTSLDPNQS
jgi:LysR family transcriptional regulator, nitrogen assimilation regulatory protein